MFVFTDSVQTFFLSFAESEKMFALKCRSNQELKEKLYSFALADDDVDKLNFLQTLCRQLANTVCKADAVSSNYFQLF